MKTKTKIFLILLCCSFFAHAQTSTFYDFNTAGDLSNYFTKGSAANNSITQSTNTGLNGSGAVNVSSASTYEVYTTKQAYSNGGVGAVYQFSSFIKSDWNGGYSAMGFTTLPSQSQSTNGNPAICLGVSVHGGGFIFQNNATQISGSWTQANVVPTTFSDLLNNGSPLYHWYKIILKITAQANNNFLLRLEVWPANSSGVLLYPNAASAVQQLTFQNNSIGNAAALYSYFGFGGSRVSNFDNYGMNLQNSTVINAGAPVVVNGTAVLSPTLNNSIDISGNVSDDRGFAVSEKGFVWSTATNPTIANNKIAYGSGLGTFNGTINNLPAGTYYLKAYAINSNGASYGTERVVIVPTQTGTILANLSNLTFQKCAGQPSGSQVFTISGANLSSNVIIGAVTDYEYSLTGTNFTSTLSLSPVSGTLASTTVYVRTNQNATGAPSGIIPISSLGSFGYSIGVSSTIVGSITTQPTAFSPASVCLNANAPSQLSVTATGTNLSYQWYVNTANSTSGATAIPGATTSSFTAPTNAAGSYYYYVVVTANCGSMTSTLRPLTVSGSPAVAITTQPISPAASCQNATPLNVSVSATGAIAYQWFSNTSNTTTGSIAISGATNSYYSIPTSAAGTKYYYVRITGGCGGTVNSAIISTTIAPVSGGAITVANSTICSGNSTTLSLSGNSGAIEWQVSSNGTSNWTTILGATSTLLNTGTLNNTRYYRAKVTNGSCPAAYSSIATVTVNPIVGFISAISGTTNVTDMASATYAVATVTYASSYVWLLPVGMTIASSTGNEITVNISSSFQGGVLSVKAVNNCGETIVRTKNITINPAIATISMTGPTSICVNTTPTASYAVNAISGCTYNWSLPIGVSLTSSSNTNNIDVAFDTSFIQGTISVTIVNGAGNVIATSSTLIGSLATPGTISGPTTLCGITTATYYIPVLTDAISYSWVVPNGMSIVGDATSNSINVTISGEVNGNIRIQAIGDCGVSPYNYLNIASTKMPGAINGPSSVCGASINATNTSGTVNSSLNSQSTYSVDTVVGATSYTWTVPTGATITSGQGTRSIVVNYNFSTFVPGQITVVAISSCGVSLPRTVNITVASASISGPTSICDLTSATYSVPSDSGTAFSWTIPSWMSLTSGSLNSNSITVAFGGPICDMGIIAVDVTSLCGPVNKSILNVACNKYTKIQNSQANSVTSINIPIYANAIAGATGYLFRIKEGNTIVATLNKTIRWFTFNEINNISFGKTYTIEVAVKTSTANYTTYGYGCATTISLQNSQIQSNQCGTTMATNLPIYADAVIGATGYRFEISNALGNIIAILEKTNRYFYLNEVSNLVLGTNYTIRVAPKNIDATTYGDYGQSCTIVAPSTKIQASQCGINIANYLPIYADGIVGATGYRFEISDTSTSTVITILDKAGRYFYLNEIAGSAFGTTYTVRVAPKNPDGLTYGNFGQACNISRLQFPSSKLQNSQCEYNVNNNNESLIANLVSGATQYRFRLINDIVGYNYSIDRPTNNFNLNMFLGLQPYTTYSVQVAVRISGEWSPFGKSCNLTTPISIARANTTMEIVNQKDFNAVAFPNPFANNFKLDVTSTQQQIIEIKVYNVLGQIVEMQTTTISDLNALVIGQNYASGVYNLIISQGENTKVLRVIKR